MTSKRLLSAVLPALLAALAAEARGAETQGQRDFVGFLYKASDGQVWFGEAMTTLGMWATQGQRPQYRPAPKVAEQLAPLVNDIGDLKDRRRIFDFAGFACGREKIEHTPTILVRFVGRYRLLGAGPRGAERAGPEEPSGKPTYEIDAAELVHAEFLPRPWLAAWQELDAALTEIAKVSLEAPSRPKRKRLAEAIERGSAAAGAMARHCAVAEEHHAIIRRIDPKARAVSLLRRDRWGPGEWTRMLRRFAARLGVQPKTPLPPEPKEPPVLEQLTASESPADFLGRLKASCPPEAIEDRVLHSPSAGRILHAWQIGDLPAEQFAIIRKEAAKALAKRRPGETEDAAGREVGEATVRQLGIIVRPATAEELARAGALSGITVARLLPGAAGDFQGGDLILNYQSVYDLAMGAYVPRWALERFIQRARQAGQWEWRLRILRGGRAVEVVIPKR
jgi:hypothetical protein